MAGDSTRYDCARCGRPFPPTADHTEIVRRDLVERPRPMRVERFCADCWEAYVSEFLDEDFDELLATYETG